MRRGRLQGLPLCCVVGGVINSRGQVMSGQDRGYSVAGWAISDETVAELDQGS